MDISSLHEAAQALLKYTETEELIIYKNDLLSLFERVKEEELIIPVLGQFKRGKSTFINYIIGEALLPTGVIPVTSIVTRLKYSEKKAADIIFEDRHTEVVEMDKLHLYISEQHNPKNVKNIKEVVVYYPSDFLKQGVSIVDTPGVGSIHKHNTDTAYEFLSHADAAIFMISADTPINEIEISFLRNIKMNVNKLYFVLNKIDILSKAELSTYISFCKDTLENIMENNSINLYPISLKLAIEAKRDNDIKKYQESGVGLLFDDLKSRIIEDKGYILASSYKDKLSKITVTMLSALKLRTNMLNMPMEKLESAVKNFEMRISEIKQIQDEAMMLLDGKCEKIMYNIETDISIQRNYFIEEIKKRILTVYRDNEREKPNQLYNRLMKSLERAIEDFLDEWRKEEDKRVEESYKNIIREFELQIDKIALFINDVIRDIFSVEYKPDFTLSGIKDMDNLFYKVGNGGTLIAVKPIDIVKLLPFKAFNRIILNHVLAMIEGEVRRNLGRVKSDYLYKIHESKIVFRSQLQSIVSKMISDIDNMTIHAMEQKRNMDDSSKEALIRIQALYDEIRTIYGNYLSTNVEG